MEKNFREKVEGIKEKVGPKSIYISRIPEKVKTRFKELAQEEFEDDYGMLLKKLVEIYDCFYPTGHDEIENKIEFIAAEIAVIKSQIEEIKEKKSGIKTVGSKIIRRKKNE